MSDQELMQMALDALDIFYEEYGWGKKQQKAHEALRARLAQPERAWQGLTDEEETELIKRWAGELVFEVTQALKEKNT